MSHKAGHIRGFHHVAFYKLRNADYPLERGFQFVGNICGEFAPKLFGAFPVGYVKEKNNRAESAAVGINAAYVKLIGAPVFIGMNFTVAVLKGRMYRCVEAAAAVNGEEALS